MSLKLRATTAGTVMTALLAAMTCSPGFPSTASSQPSSEYESAYTQPTANATSGGCPYRVRADRNSGFPDRNIDSNGKIGELGLYVPGQALHALSRSSSTYRYRSLTPIWTRLKPSYNVDKHSFTAGVEEVKLRFPRVVKAGVPAKVTVSVRFRHMTKASYRKLGACKRRASTPWGANAAVQLVWNGRKRKFRGNALFTFGYNDTLGLPSIESSFFKVPPPLIGIVTPEATKRIHVRRVTARWKTRSWSFVPRCNEFDSRLTLPANFGQLCGVGVLGGSSYAAIETPWRGRWRVTLDSENESGIKPSYFGGPSFRFVTRYAGFMTDITDEAGRTESHYMGQPMIYVTTP